MCQTSLSSNLFALQVCWICHATKGNDGNLDLAYTNTECRWKGTEYQSLPWDHPDPVLTELAGFDIRMAHPDLLHCWHLGVGRDLLGAALKVLIKSQYFPGRTHKQRLAAATSSLKRFVKNHKLSFSKKKLSKPMMNWTSHEFPELRTKGADTFAIGMWLAHLVETNPPAGLNDLSTALWTSNNVLTILARNKTFFLSDQERHQVNVLGRLFIDTYIRLAHQAILSGERLYRTRPKFHLVQHVFLSERSLNYQRYATWVDEDANKKLMKINRSTHRRTAAKRVLERWLVGVPTRLAKLRS